MNLLAGHENDRPFCIFLILSGKMATFTSMMKHILYTFCLAAFMGLSSLTAEAGDDSSDWVIEAEIHPGDPYFAVSVGNGGIGLLPTNVPFSVAQVLRGDVYDENPSSISLALNAVNPFELSMKIDGEPVVPSSMSQSLDMRRAVHGTSFKVDGKAEVDYSIRALRSMPNVGMVEVKVKALADIALDLENTFKVPGGYYEPSYDDNGYRVNKGICSVRRCSAITWGRNVKVCAASAIVGDHGDQPRHFEMKKGETAEFQLIGSVVTSGGFIDPDNESDREVVFAYQEGVDNLIRKHETLWSELWKGDIEIEGDPDAQQAARLALYHLYSFVREGSRNSISPMGLSAQGYNGHVFWDTEIWMYPPMLFLNRGIAESMVDYRTDRLQAACDKARAYGYKGAMYPWESDGDGNESCPVWALTGPFEHHITADIAIAAWNYYRMYRDKDWLRSDGWPMLKAVADFWVSRATENPDGTWSVRNVVCADEYAEGVDDNAFTNGAAIKALEYACKAARAVGEKADPLWAKVAGGLRILHDADGVTMEFEGYDGRMVKQADVNLLAYPLGIVTRKEDVLRDLEYYEEKIDKGGPAMSFSILALQYSRLGQGDKAYELFKRSYEFNRLPPFGVLAESAGATNPYFTTGAGGMLQCLINGFGGLELTDKGVRQVKSSLPSHWKSLTIKGVGPDGKTWKVTR